MGSNSFRRIVGSYAGGRYEQRGIEVRTLGVGDDVARTGRISASKLGEIEAALDAFAMACARDGAAPVVGVGTAAFRDAPNGAEVVKRAAALGVSMEIASERRESELAYLVGSLGEPGYAVVDNGSRSIELVAADGAAPQYLVATLGYRVAYDRYFAGDATALSDGQQRGLGVFLGRGRCSTCHVGFNFTDESYRNLGVGAGQPETDLGRYVVTKRDEDRGAFKTPTLRNVALTAPYMHDGSEATLLDVVEFYDRGGNANAWLSKDMQPLSLSAQEKRDLVAFMEALSGPIVNGEAPAELPK